MRNGSQRRLGSARQLADQAQMAKAILNARTVSFLQGDQAGSQQDVELLAFQR